MSLAPTEYDYGNEDNYSFAASVTCSNEDTRKMFVEGFGHMLNYNHEQAIACFTKCTEMDPDCAMAWWGMLTACPPITTGSRVWDRAMTPFSRAYL